MCAACGSMPPWAPEALQGASASTRRAVFERMAMAQRRFIEERDARLAAMKDATRRSARPAESEQTVRVAPGEAEHKPRADDTRGLDTLPPADDVPLQRARPAPDPAPPAVEIESSIDVHPDISKTSHDLELNGGAVASPPSPIPRSILTSSVKSPSPKRNSVRRAVVIDPNPERTAQRESNPNISAMSFKSSESDADSFHTAEEVADDPRDSSELDMVEVAIDDSTLQEDPAVDHGNDESDDFVSSRAIPEEQPFGSDEKEIKDSSVISTQNNATATETPLQQHPAKVEGQVGAGSSNEAIPTMSMLQLSPEHSLTSLPSENLEDSVSARRTPARERSRQGPFAPFEEYPLPSDIVTLRSADSETPLQCEDCERWRGRVEELQTKVERLTAALAARDMECASLRAKHAGKLREPNRGESRLIQERNSLRVTTEFLYRKLERYERDAHIGIGDVH